MRHSYCVMLNITMKTRSSSKKLAYPHCTPAPCTDWYDRKCRKANLSVTVVHWYAKLLVQHSQLTVLTPMCTGLGMMFCGTLVNCCDCTCVFAVCVTATNVVIIFLCLLFQITMTMMKVSMTRMTMRMTMRMRCLLTARHAIQCQSW